MKSKIDSKLLSDSVLFLPSFLKHNSDLINKLYPALKIHIVENMDEKTLTLKNKAELPQHIGLKWLNSTLKNNEHAIALWSGVACGGRLMPIPYDVNQITQVLERIEGRQHQMIMMIGRYLNGKFVIKTTLTRLKFKRLSNSERQDYINNIENWHGCLGGYAGHPQNLRFIKAINGDPGAVLGFSAYFLSNTLLSLTNLE